jgi:NifU-like protein involved in Fe-S cluster formation
MSVSELFERGFRRTREPPFAIKGTECTDPEGNAASFSLELSGDKLSAIRFQASPCTTLIAYCELIAETLPGRSLEIARAMTPHELARRLTGVPPLKQNRAVLAVAAFASALAAASSICSCPLGEPDESRLHLRHLAP